MIGGQTIGAFVITYNEQAALPDCLESIKWADDLVIVDSHSEDRTVEIARRYTDRIIEREFTAHTDQTRFAFEQARGDWVLWLDADERLTQKARDEIRAHLERPGGPECDGFSFPRRTYFLDRWIMHSGWYPQRKLRMFRREVAQIVGPAPHPGASVPGRVVELEGDILHLSYPGGVLDMMRRSAWFAELAASERYEQGRRYSPLNLLLKPPLEVMKKFLLQRGFLDGLPGLCIAVGSAYYRFVREVRLWEIERGQAPPGMDEPL